MTVTHHHTHIGREDVNWFDGTRTFQRITSVGTSLTMNKVGDVINIRNAPFSAVGDGVVDDTMAFLNALEAANGNPVYIPAGTYSLATIASHAIGPNINLIGDGATSILAGGGDQTIYPTTGKTINIRGIKFYNWLRVLTHQNTSDTIPSIEFYFNLVDTAENGIHLNCLVTYADISHNTFKNINQSTDQSALGVRLGTNTYADQPNMKKYIVSHNHFYNIQTEANDECHAVLLYGKEAEVEGNTIDTVANGNGLDCEGIYTKVLYATITNNTLINGGQKEGGITIKGGRRGETSTPQGYLSKVNGNTIIYTTPAADYRGISIHCDDVQVANNIIDGADHGIWVQTNFETENVSIIGNQISNTGLAAIYGGDYTNNLKIDGNIISGMGEAYATTNCWGIVVSTTNGDSRNVSIQNNQIRITSNTKATAGVSGIYLSSAQSGSYGFQINNNIVAAEGTITPTVYGFYITGMDGANAWHTVSLKNNILIGCDTDYNIITGLSAGPDDWVIEPHGY